MNDKYLKTLKGELGTYSEVLTEDGTYTLYSEYFDENCHSLAGATEETIFNYIEGTNVDFKYRNQEILSIFDIGFGLGIGLQTTLEKLNPDSGKLNYYSGELDEELIKHAFNNLKYKKHFPQKQDIRRIEKNGLSYYQLKNEKHSINIFIGDLRKTIPMAKKNEVISLIDCFYQDPFSPNKNPSLWTYQWFELLFSLSTKDALLSTYSCSKAARKSMLKAGWSIENVKGYNNKKKSTRAFKNRTTSQKLLEELKRSPSLALDDLNL